MANVVPGLIQIADFRRVPPNIGLDQLCLRVQQRQDALAFFRFGAADVVESAGDSLPGVVRKP